MSTTSATIRRPPAPAASVGPRLGTFPAVFAELERRLATQPAWLRELRRSAWDRFAAVGLPRPTDEDWRFTRIDPIVQTAFAVPEHDPAWGVTAKDVAELAVPNLPAGATLVFIDGRYVPELSKAPQNTSGATIASLAQALEHDAAAVRPHLAKYAQLEGDAFAALNTASIEDGAYVHVPAGGAVAEPVHLVFVSTSGNRPTVSQPRNLILVEAGASAQVVEDYVSLGTAANFTNALTEFVVGDNAEAEHYLLERENTAALNVSALRVQQGRDSRFSSHSAILGGGLVRNNVHPVLAGENCWSLVNGLYVVDGRQHVDNFMRVEHQQPHGDSRQFYKGILSGRSSAVFTGRIKVHVGAQKTDAKQSNMNLLLSDNAQANTRPQLEIYADDVKCTHGATIGQLDDEAIFYLRSRGVGQAEARGMLVEAFAGESLERMKLAPVRDELLRAVSEKLHSAKET